MSSSPGNDNPYVTVEFLERYLKENLGRLVSEELTHRNGGFSGEEKRALFERIARIESSIEAQNEKFEMLVGQMDKRFEQVDKRFEQVDKRFEALQVQMDRRFEQVDKRFEALQVQMDRRFDQMDKRFAGMQWFIGIGFTLIVALMSIYQFVT